MSDKNVIIWGIGEFGKRLVDAYLDFGISEDIVAIVDSKVMMEFYRGIRVIRPENISEFIFDEIWIASEKYYGEIYEELISLFIDESKIYRAEFLPVFDYRLRNKYANFLDETKNSEDDELNEIFEFLRNYRLEMYCYDFTNKYSADNIEISFDEDAGLYFAYFGDKRMYISRKYHTRRDAMEYVKDVVMEQDYRSPHCYERQSFYDDSKIYADIGCAEGIWGLARLDSAKHLYLIETDESWIEALKYTFLPWEDKVTICNKLVSDKDDNDFIRLDTLFLNIQVDVIKMDIEGYEYQALLGAEKLLTIDRPKLVVCTYHHENDYNRISEFLSDIGYRCEHTKGYVFCKAEWELSAKSNDFRRAVIFAESN